MVGYHERAMTRLLCATVSEKYSRLARNCRCNDVRDFCLCYRGKKFEQTKRRCAIIML